VENQTSQFLSNLKVDKKKHIRVATLFVFTACLLQSAASFKMMLGVVIFVVFSLYLYLDKLQERIIELEGKTQRLEAIPTQLDTAKPKNIDDLEVEKKETELPGKSQEVEELTKNLSNLSLNFEGLSQRLTENENSIKNLQNSLEVFAQRLDGIENSLKPILKPPPLDERPSRPLKENSTRDDIQKKIAHIFKKIESLSRLESKVNQLQDSLKRLEVAHIQQEELECLRKKVIKSDEAVHSLAEQLSQISHAKAIEDLGQRVLTLEKKGELLNSIIQLVENTHDRLTKDEDNIKVLSDSVMMMGESVNTRVDGLSQIMKDYFNEISQAVSRHLK